MVQWMRTGLPVIGCVAAIVPLLLASAVASLARRFTPVLPTDPAGEEATALMLLAIVAIMVIVTTIVLNVWMQRPRRHAGRR